MTVVQPLTSPQIVSQPQGQSALVGETVSFSLQAQGSGTVSYRWSKDGAYLSDDLRITGSAGSPLQIANVQSSDAGSYRLRVSNQAGSVDSGARGGKERGHFCPQPCERRQDVDRERLLAAAPPPNRTGGSPASSFPVHGLDGLAQALDSRFWKSRTSRAGLQPRSSRYEDSDPDWPFPHQPWFPILRR
ncbi:MAG: immunoglobulin domain-containing protein [Verrucomicrobiota bacterium]